MKWLKTYKLYLEQDENEMIEPSHADSDPSVAQESKDSNTEALEFLRKEINDFKQKKTTIETIFKQAEKDPEKFNIDEELKSKVYMNKKFPEQRNRFLAEYEQQLKTKLMMHNFQLQVEKDKTKIMELQSELNDNKRNQTSLKSTGSENETYDALKKQESILNEDIKKLKDNITNNNQKLTQIKKEKLDEQEKKFKELLLKEEKRLKEMQNATK